MTEKERTEINREYAPGSIEEMWKRRAERLAQNTEQKDEGEQVHLLILRMGREYFGFDARYVVDIRLMSEPTLVPRVPDWVVGVVTVRGQILSLIDLRRFFKLPESSSPEKTASNAGLPQGYQVSVETPGMEIALLADEVLSVEAVPLSRIQHNPAVGGEIKPEYIRGIVNYASPKTGKEGSILMILDLPALLADRDLIIDEKVL